MELFTRDQIRAIVVFGFLLSAAAATITFFNNITSPGFEFTLRIVLDSLVYPLSSLAAVGAWYLLTQVRVHDESQLRLLRRAYIFFAVQYLLVAVGYNFIITPPRNFGGVWTTSGLWLAFIGALVSALGLFLMYRTLATSEAVEPSGVS